MNVQLSRLWSNNRDVAPIVGLLLVMVILNGVLQGNMFTLGNLTTLLVELAPYIFAAMAQTIIMLLGGIDLSVGALIGLTSALIATNMHYGGLNGLAVVVVLLLIALSGALTGLIVSLFKAPVIVVTLATSFLWGGLAMQILPTPGGTVPDGVAVWITGDMGPIPMMLILYVLCIVIWQYFTKTRLGTYVYAVGDNQRGAYASGVSVTWTYTWAFAIAALFDGLAGFAASAQTGSGDPNIGAAFTVNSIAAAVLGGISFFGGSGKMIGSIIGAVVVGMLVNVLFFLGVSSFYQYLVEGAVLIIAVAISMLKSGGRVKA